MIPPIPVCVLALPSEGEKEVSNGHEDPKKDCEPVEDGGFTTQDSGGGSNTNPPPPKTPDPK